MIFLTSNLGGGEITELMTGGMGFVQPADKGEDKLDSKVERTATEAAKRKFSPEFMNKPRSEEHTSELQSQSNLVCRLLLEKKKKRNNKYRKKSNKQKIE